MGGALVYLNRTYAHIYDKITTVNLNEPTYKQVYILGDKSQINPRLYVALGDSLTSGVGADRYEHSYPYLVAENLTEKWGAVVLEHQSFPGARSSDIVGAPLEKTIAAQPKLVTILIGTNDIHGNVMPLLFSHNYEQILSRLTQETSARVYAISIPYIGDRSLLLWPYNWYFNWRIRQFNGIIKNLAARYNIQYIDLYTPTLKTFEQGGSHYAADHFHPSALGYALWAPIIYDYLNH